MFDSFGVGLGAVLASQKGPWEHANLMQIGPGAVQDGLGIVLVRFFFRLAVWDRFFYLLGVVLGRSWGFF